MSPDDVVADCRKFLRKSYGTSLSFPPSNYKQFHHVLTITTWDWIPWYLSTHGLLFLLKDTPSRKKERARKWVGTLLSVLLLH